MPPRRKPRDTCALNCMSSVGVEGEDRARRERRPNLVLPGPRRAASASANSAAEVQHAVFLEVVVAQAAGRAPIVVEVIGGFAEQRVLLAARR